MPQSPPDLFPAEQTRSALTAEPAQQVVIQRAGIPEALVAAFAALGYALSARLILTLSLLGSFVIGCMAMVDPSILKLCILIAYSALTVVPSTLLELFAKRPGD